MTDAFVDLAHHGDRDIRAGLIDLAVNVRAGGTPRWLAEHLATLDLAAYPDQSAALDAVAARHGRTRDEVLLTAGAAEAFVLIARTLRPRRAVVVHPQFTEPEAALRSAGHAVERIVLEPPFVLDPTAVPEDADLVVVGNPNNPTSVLTPRAVIESLRRPGRLVVVDEAFADCVPGEPESLAGLPALDGVIVVRSLTKTWGLAGLRVGYTLGAPGTVDALRLAQPPWPVSTPALAAVVACTAPAAVAEAASWARTMSRQRDRLLQALGTAVFSVPDPRASFVLLRTDRDDIRPLLAERGLAVRRGETFPGLGPRWIRVAVRDRAVTDIFVAALTSLAELPR